MAQEVSGTDEGMGASSSSASSSSGKRRLVADMMPEPESYPSSYEGRGIKGGEIERQRAIRGDRASILAHRHGLLMSALQAAVVKSELLGSDTVFMLSLVSKETSAVVRQNIRAIGGEAKVGDGSVVAASPSGRGDRTYCSAEGCGKRMRQVIVSVFPSRQDCDPSAHD